MTQPVEQHDPTVYPVEEKVGEDILQRWIMELLRPLIEDWLRSEGRETLVGADQFIYYRQFDPHGRVSPDIYVLPNTPVDTHVTAWKVWETGVVPSFALEIASRHYDKDYYTAPRRYDELGTDELIVFDPHFAKRPRGDGLRWQVFRRNETGELVRVEATDDDRVHSEQLGCWLRSVGALQATRVRLATAPGGDTLFPTAEERERAEKERERAEKERERAEKKAAQAELAALKAELAALKGQ